MQWLFSRKGGKSVLAVPESWIVVVNNQLKCYFPKYNAAKLIEEWAPAQTGWKLYSVRKISTKSIKSYAIAVKKESKAQFTSGVDSDSNDEECHRSRPRMTTHVKDITVASHLEKCGQCL